MTEHLARFVIRDRLHVRCLPQNLDEAFVEQVSSPYLKAIKMQDGRTHYEWGYAVDHTSLIAGKKRKFFTSFSPPIIWPRNGSCRMRRSNS